jgi:hypothetical protein
MSDNIRINAAVKLARGRREYFGRRILEKESCLIAS